MSVERFRFRPPTTDGVPSTTDGFPLIKLPSPDFREVTYDLKYHIPEHHRRALLRLLDGDGGIDHTHNIYSKQTITDENSKYLFGSDKKGGGQRMAIWRPAIQSRSPSSTFGSIQ